MEIRTKKEMILEVLADALDNYTDEEIEKIVLTINADNGEIRETTINFAEKIVY